MYERLVLIKGTSLALDQGLVITCAQYHKSLHIKSVLPLISFYFNFILGSEPKPKEFI